MGTPDPPSEPCAGGRAIEIERLLDTDSRQASTQMEPVDSPSSELNLEDTSEDSSEDALISVPDSVKPCYRVRAMGEAKKTSPALQALIDLSNVDIAPEQEQEPNQWVVMGMLRASKERPAWEHVRAESAEIKTLWSQFFSLKIQDGVLLRHHKNQGSLNEWQVVALHMICTRIFQARHHHQLAADQRVVHMQALIKQCSTGPACKKTLSRDVNSAPSAVNARRLPGGTVSYNNPPTELSMRGCP